MRIKLLLAFALAAVIPTYAITIEQCVEKACKNYPLISQYRLLEATTDIDLSDINKGWLPKASVYAQGTIQNKVPAFPGMLSDILDQMGQNVEGLGKLQYKAGLDLNQQIWDGGVSSARRKLTRSQEEVNRASLDVQMYAVRQRVENLYFATLLTEQQIAQSEITLGVLNANLEKLRALLRNGTAMASDADMVEAQVLTLTQGIRQAKEAADGYRRMLGIFTGEEIAPGLLEMPTASQATGEENQRPEYSLFDRQLELNNASLRLTDTALMPKIGLFAQSFYGYPGFDYFQSMMNRNLSFNIIAGVKATWKIDAFYTKSNNKRKAQINAERIIADRELFTFNTSLQQASQASAIKGIQEVIIHDARIVELRANVRRAAESQLTNGIIDATALLTKISDENAARLSAQLHEIQLLQEIYRLKYTLNK